MKRQLPVLTGLIAAVVGLTFGLAVTAAEAASCSKEDFAKAVDLAGVSLRKVSAESMPRIQSKMRQLKDKRGWPDQGFEERAFTALQDERIAQFDAQANDLLSRLDSLGSFTPSTEADCARLEELNATSLELLATVKAKAAYSISKLDQMLADAPGLPSQSTATAPPAADKPPKAEPKAEAKAEPKSEPKAPAAPKAAEKKAAPPTPAPKVAAKEAEPASKGQPTKLEPLPTIEVRPTPRAEPRRDETRRDVASNEPPTLAPAPNGPPPAYLPPEEDGYTIEEIKAASAGLFGKVSANLAAVIEHAFSKSGRPRGYIIGQEGGGAFIAGVRYGEGTLYLRDGGTQKIFWHGPSVGTDIGGDGSKSLFLIYRMNTPDQLFTKNFTGIDGAAYFVGGLGVTFTTNGDVILAPIRSGIGLRFGANIGYIRFTPKQTWNPF
jgi:hypothetical protein